MPTINELKLGKYRLKFNAPKKTSDAHGYYSLEYTQNIPRDYIRIYFTIRLSDTDKKAESYSVSISTWEAVKGKYLTILCHKVKESYIDTQCKVMDELKDLLLKRYRMSIPTVIYPSEETDESDTELLNNEVN